jgi:thioredoxin reductase
LPRDFEGQRVLILGKGNSALELADRILDSASLIHVASPTPLRLAWRSRHPGHPRANFTRLLDAYQLKMLHSILAPRRRPDGRITASITYAHADGEREHLVYDRVVRATGFQFDPSIFEEGTRPELTIDNRFPAMTSHWEAVNVPDMFFAGNLMQVRDFRRASSPFVDGFRYSLPDPTICSAGPSAESLPTRWRVIFS